MPTSEILGKNKFKLLLKTRRGLVMEACMIITLLSVNFLIAITPSLGSVRSHIISSYGMIVEPAGHKTLLAIKIDNLSPLTDEQLKNLAKYDLLITYGTSYNKAAIQKLRTYNPAMKIFGYRNVAFIDNRSADITLARANGWVLKDTAGNEVYEKNYPFLKLVDVGNASYREWVAERIHYLMTELVSLDGVFGDNTHSLINQNIFSARPINPRTGALYTDQEWRDDTLALVKKVKEKFDKLYIANGAGLFCGAGSTGFWQNQGLAEVLLSAVDGVLLEGFIRWENEPWRSTTNWKKDVDFLKFVNEKGKIAIAWTICSGTLPSGATQNQIAMYGYATYLLAASGDKSYFRAKGYDDEFYNIARISVGFPLEEYHVRGDAPVYEREFSKALILVNPTDNSFTLSLNGNYESIEGQPVSSVILPAKSGLFLIKKP
jgi:hypothetical protein